MTTRRRSRSRDGATRRRRWRRWIKSIRRELTAIVYDEFVFKTSMDRIKLVERIPPTNQVYQWIIRSYATYLAMGVRRMLDHDKRTYSLRLLLKDIADHSEDITRRSFVRRYPDVMRSAGLADADFDRIAGEGVNSLPSEVVQEDLATLDAIHRHVSSVINKQVAHNERSIIRRRKIKWQELHDAVATMEALCKKYSLVLEQAGVTELLPTNVSADDNCFDECWGRVPARHTGIRIATP